MSESFEAMTRSIAEEFLQSVVVVDDRAYLGVGDPGGFFNEDSPHPRSAAIGGNVLEGRRGVSVLQPPPTDGIGSSAERDLDAKALTEGFAGKGIVCGVLRPDDGESLLDGTMRAAQRADILILDWVMHQDGGSRTLELLDELIGKSADRRLRLIAIYTAQADLTSIGEQLVEVLDRLPSLENGKKTSKRFTWTRGPVRIVLLAKEGAPIPSRLRSARKRIVPVAKLPSHLVMEFAEFAGGLVPNVALDALAALRTNTHRILSNLRADLDPAYLMHRAMLPMPSDAEEHLTALVASEICSVLDDAEPGRRANIDAIRLWLSRSRTVDYAKRFGVTGTVHQEDIEALLEHGIGSKGPEVMELLKLTKPHKKEIAAFADTYDKARMADARLAGRMSMKSRHDNPRPHLALGAILSTGNGTKRRYWLCLQPRCNSVRLEEPRPFPIVPLSIVKNSSAPFDLVVPGLRGGHVKLKVARKSYELSMERFAPSDSGKVEAEVHARRGYCFRSMSRKLYEFQGELRPEKAQRIVQEFASQFERIGLNDSEWLRRWSAGLS